MLIYIDRIRVKYDVFVTCLGPDRHNFYSQIRRLYNTSGGFIPA